MKQIVKLVKSTFKFSGKFEQHLAFINLVFIFVFLNLWDFLISRELFNAMIIGIVLLGPAVFLWYLGSFRAIVVLNLISIFEFTMMLVFVLEGLELSGIGSGLKSLFWFPYLVISGVNGFIGLKIYSEAREKLVKIRK